MNIELVRMNAAAMSDATLGVNAQIDALPLDVSLVTGLPDVRPPHVVRVLNQADHNIEVREADDESQYPVIVVCARSDFSGAGQVFSGVDDDEGDISLVYVTRSAFDATNFRTTDYTLRAIRKAVHAYLLASNTRDVNGQRNGIAIKSAKRKTIGHAQGAFMGGQAAGVLKITYAIRTLIL